VNAPQRVGNQNASPTTRDQNAPPPTTTRRRKNEVLRSKTVDSRDCRQARAHVGSILHTPQRNDGAKGPTNREHRQTHRTSRKGAGVAGPQHKARTKRPALAVTRLVCELVYTRILRTSFSTCILARNEENIAIFKHNTDFRGWTNTAGWAAKEGEGRPQGAFPQPPAGQKLIVRRGKQGPGAKHGLLNPAVGT